MVGYSTDELRRFTPLDISVEDERSAAFPVFRLAAGLLGSKWRATTAADLLAVLRNNLIQDHANKVLIHSLSLV